MKIWTEIYILDNLSGNLCDTSLYEQTIFFSQLIASADSCSFLFSIFYLPFLYDAYLCIIWCDLLSSGHEQVCVGCVCAGILWYPWVLVGICGMNFQNS